MKIDKSVRSHPFSRDTKQPVKKHSLYNRWLNMRNYCNSKTHVNYHLYGAKGIKVFKEWNDSYNAFLLWAIKNGFKEGLILCRLDKSKDFEPSNCIWSTSAHVTESSI